MAALAQRIEVLKLHCSKYSQAYKNAAELDAFHNKASGACSESSDFIGDLEVSLRALLAELLQNDGMKEKLTEPDAAPWRLIKFTIEFAKKYSKSNESLSLPRIPFKMIEDILEMQTIAEAERIWPIVEDLAANITHPDLFTKGNFMVLKTCNSLLKKLSKSCNTEFCGRVLMFLAAIYPIAEKSALNIPGKINSNNVTYFEDVATFASASTATAGVEESNVSDGAAAEETSVMLGDISYDMYKAFWELQSFFASESKIIDSTDVWSNFMTHAKQVLSLFQRDGYNFTNKQLQQARETLRKKRLHQRQQYQQKKLKQQKGDSTAAATTTATTATANADMSEHNYLGCKYLTSSQLFALQLKDPLLRQQISVQILYFIHYLRAKVVPFTEAEVLVQVAKDMQHLHNQAYSLIERTPAEGKKLLEVIKRLLSREKHWIAWKNSGCSAFVKHGPAKALAPLLDDATVSSPTAATAATTNATGAAATTATTADKKAAAAAALEQRKRQVLKRKLGNLSKPSSDTFLQYQCSSNEPTPAGLTVEPVLDNLDTLARSYVFDTSLHNAKEIATELGSDIPSYERMISDYYEAEDPDNGIEDEYHPKHDDLYCWRARRLMAAKHLHAFEAMPDGDIGRGLKKLSNDPTVVAEVDEWEDTTTAKFNFVEDTAAASATVTTAVTTAVTGSNSTDAGAPMEEDAPATATAATAVATGIGGRNSKGEGGTQQRPAVKTESTRSRSATGSSNNTAAAAASKQTSNVTNKDDGDDAENDDADDDDDDAEEGEEVEE